MLTRILTIALVGSIATAAQAEDDSPRALAGHLFIPSNLVTDPFTATWFASQTGFGYTRAVFPDVDENGMPTGGSHTIKLAPLAQGFGLQVGVLPRYWALRLGGNGSVMAPISLDGAIDVGAQVGYQVQAGTTASARIGRRLRLGGAFDVSYGRSLQLNIYSALQKSAAAMRVDATTLLVRNDITQLKTTATVALALHRSLGLVASVDYLYELTSSDGKGFDDAAVDLAATVDFDVHALVPVPLGIAAAYTVAIPVATAPGAFSSQASHRVAFGLYYSGRASLLLGPELQVLVPPPTGPGTSILSFYGIITMRYYW